MANVDAQADQPPHRGPVGDAQAQEAEEPEPDADESEPDEQAQEAEEPEPEERSPIIVVATRARAPETAAERAARATDIQTGAGVRARDAIRQVNMLRTQQEKIEAAKNAFTITGDLAVLSAHATFRSTCLRKTFELEPYDPWFAEWRVRHYTEAEIRTEAALLVQQGLFVEQAQAVLGAGAGAGAT